MMTRLLGFIVRSWRGILWILIGLLVIWACDRERAYADGGDQVSSRGNRPIESDSLRVVRITWYLATGQPMYSGRYPYRGAAACSWDMDLGTVLELPDGRQVVCLDRGLLGRSGWVDVYSPTVAEGRAMARQFGDWALVTVK